MGKPAKAKLSAERVETPEAHEGECAPTVAIAGAKVQIPRWKKDGSLVWQKLRGRPSLGAELMNLTRSAIAGCDGDPLEVVQKLINDLPEAVLANCAKANADPVEISRKVERYLPPPDGTDQGLRSKMIARRLDCFEANPRVERVRDDTWRGSTYADLDRFAVDTERVDQANMSLLDQSEWRKIPEKVLLVILRELGYPRPDNVTRYEVNWG